MWTCSGVLSSRRRWRSWEGRGVVGEGWRASVGLGEVVVVGGVVAGRSDDM